jgi:Undecaprenyl-phosphate glucose phosphotransferase
VKEGCTRNLEKSRRRRLENSGGSSQNKSSSATSVPLFFFVAVPFEMTRRSINLLQYWLTIGLFSVPSIAFILAGYIRFASGYFAKADFDPYAYSILTVLVTLLWAFVVEHLGVNKLSTLLTLQTGFITATKATVYCALLSLSVLFFYRPADFARIFVALGCLLILIISLVMIHFFRGAMHILEQSPNGRFPIAILGADEYAERVGRHLSHSPPARCRVACYVALSDQTTTALASPVLPWDHLEDVVEAYHCQEIVVALPPQRLGEVKEILKVVQHLCIPARLVLDLGEGVFVPERIFDYYGIPLLDVQPYPIDTVSYAVGKRAFDITFSCLALLFTAPVMMVIATLTKLTSRGPILFLQERVSLNGKRFKMFKFRTMFVNDSDACNFQHTCRSDVRITPFGRFLRKTSLDELPQFLNVLQGDMSVVGPRPELTFFVQKFRSEIPWYMSRHNVKCGITGWAQVNGLRGSDSSIPQRIQYDLYYLQNWTFGLDLRIIAMTILSGLINRNAY